MGSRFLHGNFRDIPEDVDDDYVEHLLVSQRGKSVRT